MEVKHALVWFWLELLHAAKSLARGRVWSGGSYIETLRRYIKTLLDHQYNRSAAPGSWMPLEATISDEDRVAVRGNVLPAGTRRHGARPQRFGNRLPPRRARRGCRL